LLLNFIFKSIILFVRFLYWTRLNWFFEFFIYLVLHYILRYRKSVILKNLHILHPLQSDKFIHLNYKKNHRYLASLILESIWAFGASAEEIYPKLKFKNLDIFDEINSQAQNVTILISHIGNWELFCQWAALYIPKVNVNVLYTPIKNKSLNKTILQLRQRFGARLVSTKSTLDLFRIQNEEEVAINLFAIDQNPGNPYHQHWLPFFGKDVPVISGAEKFAKSQNQKVYFLYVTKSINYELELIELPFEVAIDYDLTVKQFEILEKNILENSSLWLLSHNRFKYQPKD
jgi:Kdo2-lipid IVA lauroyltransferase/acyltransferase